MRRSLLSERTVKRWVAAGCPGDGNQHTIARDRDNAFYDHLRDALGQDAAKEFEEVVSGDIEAEQARVLTYVGTVLLQHDHADLWRQIFDVVYGSGLIPRENWDMEFLDEQMAAAVPMGNGPGFPNWGSQEE